MIFQMGMGLINSFDATIQHSRIFVKIESIVACTTQSTLLLVGPPDELPGTVAVDVPQPPEVSPLLKGAEQ